MDVTNFDDVSAFFGGMRSRAINPLNPLEFAEFEHAMVKIHVFGNAEQAEYNVVGELSNRASDYQLRIVNMRIEGFRNQLELQSR